MNVTHCDLQKKKLVSESENLLCGVFIIIIIIVQFVNVFYVKRLVCFITLISEAYNHHVTTESALIGS